MDIVRFIGQKIYNRTPESGINEEMYVDINGTKQWISIYGQDKDNPVLFLEWRIGTDEIGRRRRTEVHRLMTTQAVRI